MRAANLKHSLSNYLDSPSSAPVFLLQARPSFSPLDLNVAFLQRLGWNQSVDRVRFHVAQDSANSSDHPLAEMLKDLEPHILIRRLDRDEDRFVSVQASVAGEIILLSNDAEFARSFFAGLFLECPPSFHTIEEFELSEAWETDSGISARFAGMLAGAFGWDPSHNIPENIQQSLDEARGSLEIANYRACVVMARRSLEAVLKFGYERLLKQKPVNKKGQALMLNDLIQALRSHKPSLIPDHLLHVADSIRVLGNVPGAHAADIANYHFSRSDAEFALYATIHFLDQYFSKIDQEVTEYYTLTVDLDEKEEGTD